MLSRFEGFTGYEQNDKLHIRLVPPFGSPIKQGTFRIGYPASCRRTAQQVSAVKRWLYYIAVANAIDDTGANGTMLVDAFTL